MDNSKPGTTTVAIQIALQMLESGWTVRWLDSAGVIEWRSPCGLSGSDMRSQSIDRPPRAAIVMARRKGHVDMAKIPLLEVIDE